MSTSKRPEKLEISRMRLSTPIILRTNCKRCAGAPVLCYQIRFPRLEKDPRTNSMSHTEYDWHHFKEAFSWAYQSTRDIRSVSHLTFPADFSKYRPKLMRSTKNTNEQLIEFVTCGCMETTWSFSDKTIIGRPDIANRKSSERFPSKIESFRV